jgi:hypothetical protein
MEKTRPSCSPGQRRHRRLGAAQHLQHQQRRALHCLFRRAADGRRNPASDRPDQVGIPHLSTSRKVREDYFGLGANNASYFSIPINVPGGSGPNHGRFGTLGRNTFRGPAYYDFDFALIKTRLSAGARVASSGWICSFAPSSSTSSTSSTWACRPTLFEGSGFGEISRTAGTSRQIQFSLKLI